MFLSYLLEKVSRNIRSVFRQQIPGDALFKKNGTDFRGGGNLLERLTSHYNIIAYIEVFVIDFVLRVTDKFEIFTARVEMYITRIYV